MTSKSGKNLIAWIGMIFDRPKLSTLAFGLALCFVSLSSCDLDQPSRRISDRPNVMVLLSDDQGTLDLNCYGSEDLSTPNLDALARRGIRFTQFYAASSVCSPSRAGLLTGLYPHRAGVPGNAESRPELFGTGRGLAAEQVTIAEVLKEAGYRTGHFGKWHLGTQPGPNGSGFDESVGFLGGCIDKWSHFNYGGDPWGTPPQRHDWYRNGQEWWETGSHSGDLIVREAIRFISAESDKPFFAYVAFGTPHYPLQPYDKFRRPSPNRAWHWQLGSQWAVREGNWKLIFNAQDTSDGRHVEKIEGPFLVNLAEDPAERVNLGNDRPDQVKKLTRLHNSWWNDVQ